MRGAWFWSIAYIVAVLVANYTAVWFIPLPVFGLVAFGTLVFGVTFTARDYAHRLGRRYVYTMIVVSALASIALSLLTEVSGRVVLASTIAILLAETADTEVYQRLLDRPWLQRVAGSNAVSIPLDSLLFNLVAFLGVFPLGMLVAIVFGEVVVKSLVGVMVALWRLI